MRILLDGVFNHCGYWWDKFQDVVKNGKASPYRSWFFIHSYPVDAERQNYDCVGHYKWMPKLNLADPDARDYFLSVGRYWLAAGCGGRAADRVSRSLRRGDARV